MDREIQSSEIELVNTVSLLSVAVSTASLQSDGRSCRICLSVIQYSARLNCSHEFCEECLDKYWKLHGQPHFLVCPLCRGYAFSVQFCKRAIVTTTREFRRTFEKVGLNKRTISLINLINTALRDVILNINVTLAPVFFSIINLISCIALELFVKIIG